MAAKQQYALLRKRAPRRQLGVALISILLVLAVLATLAIYSAEDQDIAIHRMQNLGVAEQGYQINLSGEQWVVKVLEKDIANDKDKSQEDGKFDHVAEIWGNLGPPVEVGETGATLLMSIEDLHGRFNLNNLIQGKRQPARPEAQADEDPVALDNAVDSAEQGENPQPVQPEGNQQPPPVGWFQVYSILLIRLGLNPELVDPLIDWIDSNQDTIGTTGAEDLYYSGLELPYRAANRPLTSVAELAMIKDYDAAAMALILPFVTALPVDERNTLTRINVNTASIELLALFAAEQPQKLEDLLPLFEVRQVTPFKSVDEFAQQFDQLVPAGLVSGYQNMLGVTGDYFAGRSCAQSGRVKFSMMSLLQKRREDGNVKVLQRERFLGCPDFAVETPPTTADTAETDQ